MFADGGGGALFPAGDVAALRTWILRLIREPELLREWRRSIPDVKSADAHAAEVEDLYRGLRGAHTATAESFTAGR
jgi:glycosyltransferase involved in cell wall biosynthesis